MENEKKIRREILEKHWTMFQLSIGNTYHPMSERAYEYMEAAMEEYAENKIKELQLI